MYTPPKYHEHILVFGSLRQNSSRGFNFNRFGENSQNYLKTYLLPNFDMYSVGPFPAICVGKGNIVAELHNVHYPAFRAINSMEVGAGYTPLQMEVEYDGAKINATIYVVPAHYLVDCEKVENGDWD